MTTSHESHLRHTSQQFNLDLENLQSNLLKMGDMVQSQIQKSMEALENQDCELAQEIRANDKSVDKLQILIDEETSRVFVKRQPTASDLRFVVSIVKMVVDLERVGDEAKKIAKCTLSMFNERTETMSAPIGFVETRQIAKHVVSMFQDALDSFINFDTELALSVMKEDRRVDDEYKMAVRSLSTHMMEDPREVTNCLSIIWMLHALERVGDHACNIAEHVIYIVKGEDVRHAPMDKAEQVIHR
ncbi:MAG: phosphate signaling complex protein PhoU [Halomonas sp.]|uniref:phosphate signaling complex protein PhoU n=1 Tax=Halomonas sp. TaxID=1486246 RepID=UPI002ACEECC4|nr:phosphate signaling complex protein PhoU [Halomonas sp.]MDZ7852395.1 phosphate signaling complex protein PhoU [Halomonas sp.]